jgi:sugar lactone lactonase YvrE/4-amino-4-deoxy-L-arabinose transferase-like glycosyltransferase
MQYTKPDYIEQIQPASGLDTPVLSRIKLNPETIVFALIIILAIFTRFYKLEPRVMSHDETSHVYFSWLFFRGNGYAHDPVTHGPMQFHIVALSYFLFGDSDTSARIPAVLFSIATVGFIWFYRRYLGRVGAIIAALMFTISPYMLYYGRYVRNEAFVALFGVMMIWAILRYFETGHPRYLYWLTAVTVLHFTTKETSFIYTAQALLFLGLHFVYRITQKQWIKIKYRLYFLLSLISSLIFLSFGIVLRSLVNQSTDASGVITPNTTNLPSIIPISLLILGLLSLTASIYFLIRGYTLPLIRRERSFDLVILLGTLVLPQLSAFVINFFGWKNPVNASEVASLTIPEILQMALVLVPMIIGSIVIGLWWNRRQWLINAGIWYSIFTVLYTSMFTNGAGFFTGLVGSLGYWLEQQAVNRGGQPFYYYALLQIPIYEYLPALGCLLALIYGAIKALKSIKSTPISPQGDGILSANEPQDEEAITIPPSLIQSPPIIALFGFWTITSLLAYSIAGEKMPWLTVHIALPMILVSAWFFGHLVDTFNWSAFRQKKGILGMGLLLFFIPAILSALRSLLGGNPPFVGHSLEQLSSTSQFLIAIISAVGSGIGLYIVMKDWLPSQVRRAIILVPVSLLAVLTARTAFTASYINYDRATEFLVYAHSGPGDKIALAQIEEISRRLTGGLDLPVAYDSDTTYPYWWYLRNYTNPRFYGSAPTRDLRDVPVILVGGENFGKIEPIVGQAYYRFDYIRIWWPIEDYDNLTWERVIYAMRDPQMREALFRIWLFRDYTLYGQLTNRNFNLQNWSPSGLMRLYIRKDIVAQLWDYGTGVSSETVIADPYEGKPLDRSADFVFGSMGVEPGQFQNPRDIALAPDGSLYVADTMNHRIQHLTTDGTVLQVWGSFADLAGGDAPGGTFYEPWGVAVGPDGTVYVTDTWNHRVQRFSSEGEFISTWGFFGQGETPFALWGPRDIAIDANGQVFVADTGNKRVVIYDADGNYITQFGSVGFDPGQFDEPVGIAVDKDGLVYIADTWNQRIQIMVPDGTGNYIPFLNWEVVAWYGQSLDNKPYIAVDTEGNLYTSDPEGYRILHFTRTGTFVDYFGDYGSGQNAFNLPTGLSVDSQGGIWVVDSANNRIMHFSIPGN